MVEPVSEEKKHNIHNVGNWEASVSYFLDMVQLEQYDSTPSVSAETDVALEVNLYFFCHLLLLGVQVDQYRSRLWVVKDKNVFKKGVSRFEYFYEVLDTIDTMLSGRIKRISIITNHTFKWKWYLYGL